MRVARTSEEGCASWTTFQISGDRTARDACLKGTVPKLSLERVVELGELDRVARTCARQRGHSHVIAQMTALSSSGRVVGRLTCGDVLSRLLSVIFLFDFVCLDCVDSFFVTS